MIQNILMSVGLLIALPFILIGLAGLIAWHDKWLYQSPPETRAADPRRPEAAWSPRKDPEQALADLKPRILAKEEELGALRAEEFRLSLEAGRVRDPYRGGVTDDGARMPALTDDVLHDASKRKA